MKSKMLIATLLGCLVWQQGVLSQTDTIATDINQSGMGASTAVSSSATSSVAALTVVFPPSIAKQPANQTVVNGNDATFSVTAGGTPPLSYQWYFNGNAISEATAANYSITECDGEQRGQLHGGHHQLLRQRDQQRGGIDGGVPTIHHRAAGRPNGG